MKESEHIKYKKLYLGYCRELDLYFPEDKRETSDKKYLIEFISYISDLSVTFSPIQNKEELCGFLILKDGKALNIDGYDFKLLKCTYSHLNVIVN